MKLARVAVLADDLTGGAAIAGEIARDLERIVEVHSGAPPEDPSGLVVVETGSRYLPPEAARARVQHEVASLHSRGADILMKKVDSTLKGNVAVELAAFVASVPGPVVVAPACPAVGLRIVDGMQQRPMGAGTDVLATLESAVRETVDLLRLDDVRAGSTRIADVIAKASSRVILSDATSDEDLRSVVHGAIAAGVRFFAGTYGLGAALADATGPNLLPVRNASELKADRILVVIGSANPVTDTQRKVLKAFGAKELLLDVPALLRDAATEHGRLLDEVRASSASVVIVHTGARDSERAVRTLRDAAGWSERDLANVIAPPLVDAIRAMSSAGVYFVGGETTGAVAELLGWSTFAVVDEVTPGVPLAIAQGAPNPFILTKPGAFGDPDALVVAIQRMLASASSPRAAHSSAGR
ncbi:4-hydroxythreonine-4-phosphate dehydrogenase [Georgenia soli]|uniref:4-hydroxythreonine-4-phosphate dehydrogenase n=1 Tax=Georgenia soli TaxID=638953 RepID=A0A2A9F3U9_9MICO|nr:four-carbon acid sugar kinase family protein [Georgenia soli]PFG45089.1 4-hydroxythreonine-4-phosphate dehydrogenase [Georgenia soli]